MTTKQQWVIVGGAFLLVGAIGSMLDKKQADPIPPSVVVTPSATAESQPATRIACVFGAPGFPEMTIPLFRTEADLGEFIDVMPTGDGDVMNAVRRRAGALLVEPNVRCKTLDVELFGSKHKVAVLDGPHKGQIGWTVKAWSTRSETRR